MFTWVAIAKLLLTLVAQVMERLSDEEQREIGRDQNALEAFRKLTQNQAFAKAIDHHVSTMSDDDVDDFLQRYYRNEGKQDGSK